VSTTAWRFSGTEGADAAVLRLKQLDTQELVDVQDVSVLRWPQYASGPQVQEHVTDEGSRTSSLAKRIRKAGIDSALLQAVKDDMARPPWSSSARMPPSSRSRRRSRARPWS
jgi:hypothetical protein